MLHNLFIVDYGLGHPGSVHDTYAFQGTRIAQEAEALILENHWVWTDSTYPMQTWCVVPFKATRNTPLSRPQKVYCYVFFSPRSSAILVAPLSLLSHPCRSPLDIHLPTTLLTRFPRTPPHPIVLVSPSTLALASPPLALTLTPCSLHQYLPSLYFLRHP